MKHKSVFKFILVFAFVFTFALALQIAAGDDDGDQRVWCCYEPCSGVGLGDWGHWDGDPEIGKYCNCQYDPQYFKCTHECNICLQ
jgi:hypothetical protein